MADLPARPKWAYALYLLIALVALWALNRFPLRAPAIESVPYSALVAEVEAGRVKEVEVRREAIFAKLEGDKLVSAVRLPGFEDEDLLRALKEKGIPLTGKIEEPAVWGPMLFGWLLPLGLLFGAYFFLMRRFQKGTGGAGGPLSFGRNRAKIYDESKSTKVTFADVAGIDESVAEMREVVEFLKNPGKYRAIGAKIPKGVLLVGPPGTGKTLLAKAVAGESKVPFFSLSGSDFVEMFVGVGAARVRDLFQQAAERSPCIIFIDEIDAIGKSRGGIAAFGGHDEREQTLNQLLSEMDGFDPKAGIVIMAATNRPEVLDPALVRSGRFDRQVIVDRPSVAGRKATLVVHSRSVKLEPDVDLDVIARRTPGMVGADLEKVVNEAALAAARQGATAVAMAHFEEAVDRIQLGLKKEGRALSEEEKRRVAIHEAGHALVAMSVEHADPVHKVTIIPRSIGALGATLQLPTEDRYLMLKSELSDRIAVMLGGRAAEALVLGEGSTGAENDLERATETARAMVCRFGMSERLGPQSYGRGPGARYLDSPFSRGEQGEHGPEVAKAIDEEVQGLLRAEERRAQDILRRRQALLAAITTRLLEAETLDGPELDRLRVEVEGSPSGAEVGAQKAAGANAPAG